MIINAPIPGQVPALRRLWQEAFGDTDAFLSSFFAVTDGQHGFTATQDGQVAGALYWFDCTCRGKKLAYLYGVATAKAFRGQGVCHALMEHTHRHLQEAGYAGALLVPGEESLFRFYGKMGYTPFGAMTERHYTAGTEPADLRAVDLAEYALSRRQLLPEGGVIQEGKNLDFLACQAQLYAGKDFILAARQENGSLLGLELLGKSNPEGILAALGCTEGTFRMFGEGAPFAMYRPLSDAPAPRYFAFAFD